MLEHFSNSIFSYFQNTTPLPLPPLNISDFIEKRIVSNDEWNSIKNGNIRYEYFKSAEDKHPCAYIDFRPGVGQIGLFFVTDEKLHNRGLGKQILTKAIRDIKEFGTADTVWVVSSENHPFWSNVWNKSFVRMRPAHRSVTGSGFSMKLGD